MRGGPQAGAVVPTGAATAPIDHWLGETWDLTFYRLQDGRGWVHDFHPDKPGIKTIEVIGLVSGDKPTICNVRHSNTGVEAISDEMWKRVVKMSAVDGLFTAEEARLLWEKLWTDDATLKKRKKDKRRQRDCEGNGGKYAYSTAHGLFLVDSQGIYGGEKKSPHEDENNKKLSKESIDDNSCDNDSCGGIANTEDRHD